MYSWEVRGAENGGNPHPLTWRKFCAVVRGKVFVLKLNKALGVRERVQPKKRIATNRREKAVCIGQRNSQLWLQVVNLR